MSVLVEVRHTYGETRTGADAAWCRIWSHQLVIYEPERQHKHTRAYAFAGHDETHARTHNDDDDDVVEVM